MREILFRGKQKDNGEWIEGYLLNDGFEGLLIAPSTIYSDYDDLPGIFKERIIIPDTVGQYTGLIDKNGQKIFEGDIVCEVYEANSFFPVRYGPCGVCVYNTDTTPRRYIGFYIDWKYFADIKRADIGYWYNRVIVIGNIHDNPELLNNNKEDL